MADICTTDWAILSPNWIDEGKLLVCLYAR